MTIKANFFDIDGTLIDSNSLHVLAWEEAFSAIGVQIDRHLIHDQIGKGADKLIPALMPELDEPTMDRLGKAEGEIFKQKYLASAKPFDGVRDLLETVHARGQKVVLATSSSQEQVEHYLDLLDVRPFVIATTSSDDVNDTKPAPDIFATALAKLPGVAFADCLVVGDTPYDIEAAKECGIATVALRAGGFSDETLQRAGAIAIYDDVAALLSDYDRPPLAR